MFQPIVRLIAIALVLAQFGAGWAQPGGVVPSAPPTVESPYGVQPLVYVPYDRAGGPQLGMQDSVLLPYAEFLRLQQAGLQTTEGPSFHPVAALVGADYRGEATGDVALFQVEVRVEALARPKDVLAFDLPFAGAAIERAAVEGPQATLGPLESGAGFRLRLVGAGPRVVRLTLAAPIKTVGAERRLSLSVPRAASASIQLRLTGDVELVNAADSLPAVLDREAGGAVVLRAPAGGRDRIELAWRPRVAPGGEAARARLAVDQRLVVQVEAQQVRARDDVWVNLLAGGVSAVDLELPRGSQLLHVSGPFVKSWSDADAQGRLRVELVREVSEPFSIALEMQWPAGAADQPLVVPEVRVPAAVRESGLVVLSPPADLTLWPEEVVGLEAAPAEGVTAAGARGFRFSQPGWRLTVTRRPVTARVRVDGLLVCEVGEELVRLIVRDRLQIGGRGIFGVQVDAPEGYELREAGPADLIAGFRQQGRRVEIHFRGEQVQSCQLELSFQSRRAGGDGRLTLEPVVVVGADQDAGSIVIAAPRALRIGEIEARGLEATDVRQLQERLAGLLGPDQEPVLGYRYFTPTFRAVASIERQPTRITCETALLASIEPSLMSVSATLNYEVEFSATDQFRLRAPASVGEALRIGGADIKEKLRATPGANDELTTWTVRLQRRVLGPYRLTVAFDLPVPAAEAGKPTRVRAPSVGAAGVARETGWIAVARRENLEVRVAEKAEGLEPRDIKELPPSLAEGFLGFRYFDPRQTALELDLTRHELESVLGALIRRMHIETVVSEQRETMHEVTFEIQNNRAQYLKLMLPEEMEIWSAFVRGMPVRTTRQSDGARLIELTKSESMDTAFRVRLILSQKLAGGRMKMFGSMALMPPQPLDIPVLRTTWRLFLPKNFRYVAFGGTMRQETGGRPPWIEPAAEKLLSDMPARVAGGIARPLLNPPQINQSPNYNAAETEEERKARLQGAALEIPIVREGLQYDFSMLSGVGDLRVKYWKRKPLVILQGGLALVLFAGLLARMRGRRRLTPGVGMTLATFLLASLAAGFWGLMFATALAASAAALIVAAVFVYGSRLRAGWHGSGPAAPGGDARATREPRGPGLAVFIVIVAILALFAVSHPLIGLLGLLFGLFLIRWILRTSRPPAPAATPMPTAAPPPIRPATDLRPPSPPPADLPDDDLKD